MVKTSSNSPAMSFIIAQLENDPDVEYSALKERANEQGLSIAPILYGRARASLGIAPKRPRKESLKGRSLKAAGRGPSSKGNGSVEDIEERFTQAITGIQAQATTDSRRLREAMQHAIKILEAALER